MICKIKYESGKTFARLPKIKSCSPLSYTPKLSKREILSDVCALAYEGINKITKNPKTAKSRSTKIFEEK